MGILLVIATIVIYQGGNVVAKKMSTPPFLMILVRDVISLFLTAPLNIQTAAGANITVFIAQPTELRLHPTYSKVRKHNTCLPKFFPKIFAV